MRVSCALRVCVALLVVVPAGALAAGLEDFEGTWVRVDREREDAARYAEIDRVTEGMSFVFRGFARGVMRRRMRPIERWIVARGAEAVSIRTDAGVEFPLDGRPHPGGQDQQVTSTFTGDGEIQQSWRHGEESHGTTVWRLDETGSRLVLSDRVHDSHFARPVEYSTTYERADAGLSRR
jgi:hypothetical protein